MLFSRGVGFVQQQSMTYAAMLLLVGEVVRGGGGAARLLALAPFVEASLEEKDDDEK